MLNITLNDMSYDMLDDTLDDMLYEAVLWLQVTMGRVMVDTVLSIT